LSADNVDSPDTWTDMSVNKNNVKTTTDNVGRHRRLHVGTSDTWPTMCRAVARP